MLPREDALRLVDRQTDTVITITTIIIIKNILLLIIIIIVALWVKQSTTTIHRNLRDEKAQNSGEDTKLVTCINGT